MTNKEAASLVAQALMQGLALTVACPNGDTLTAGRRSSAVGPSFFHALRWGRSRFADPSGREVARNTTPAFLAPEIVENCGRGNAALAARRAMGHA